jgi:hypothetical protein
MAEGEYEESLLRDYVMGIGYRSGFAADESRGPHRATVMEGDS